ncbi:MAG: GyrI-like domain-containing protein [Methanobrevibacter sp.]|jgi:effector-binding domain-containing protein|nr:GyrI-like domain-containing protein [Candidatus Methanovirga aequatorialis]
MDVIKEKSIKDQKMAIINYKGNVKDMDVLIARLITWCEVEDIEIKGHPFSIYYTSPKNTDPDEMIYDVGIEVRENTEVTDHLHGNTAEVQVVELLSHKVLYKIHEGSYETIDKSYRELANYAVENNYDIIGSPKEIYLNSPHEVKKEELLTEIQFPVIKMGK